ncbi:hypothetical protein KUCAC02_024764 [Chaenocephalus aceratus]|nr:hypothetical protein KUCAC02_024764 [Chaenocephalus aceratus]
MEAAVLNSAIIPEVDCNSNTVDAELEGTGGFCLPSPVPTLLCESSLGSSLEEPFDYFHSGGWSGGGRFRAVGSGRAGTFGFDSLCCSDRSDETWLYVSSKSRECTDNSLSALQWCRKALESPRSEVEAARRSLSLRLEQVSRWRSSLSSPSPTSSPGLPLIIGKTRFVPLLPIHHRTMSPVGKDLSPFSERTPTFFPAQRKGRSLRRCALSPQSSMDSDLGSSEVDDDSISLGYKLQDLTGRPGHGPPAGGEENSLRQDYASTAAVMGPRRSQSFTFQLSQLSAGLAGGGRRGDDERLRPPAPRAASPHPPAPLPYFLQRPRLAKKHPAPCPHPPSTTPHLSAGFAFQPQLQTQHGFRPGSASGTSTLKASDLEKESLKGLALQSFDSSSGLARLQSSIPSPGQLQNRVQSVGNFSSMSRQTLKATAYVSPTIKGSMATSTSLHSLKQQQQWKQRGGCTSSSTSRSKVAQSARSLLTPPKTLTTFSALRDSNWRDGCY